MSKWRFNWLCISCKHKVICL